MAQLPPFGADYRRQGTNLVQHLCVDRLRRQCHGRAAKIFPVREAGVRPNGDPIFQRLTHAGQHGLGISGVKTAGDVG
ncbi:hypothetical protein D3C76_1531330 [compost metagenome]